MKPFRFVQLSDVHLDSLMHTSALRLPPDKRRIRRGELRAVLTRACDLARDEGADFMLIPGDLWDDESVSADTIAFIIDTLGRAPCPVVVTPGNHDFYSPSSFYHGPYLAAKLNLRWPENVHVVSSPQWVSFRVPGIEGVAFTGICFTANVPVTRRYLADPLPKAADALNVLVFHGSREGHAPAGKRLTLPFTDDELLAAGFDYAAIGHYHSFGTVEDATGRVRGAYSGCPAGRGLDECGEKVVLVGELDPGRGVSLRAERLDGRTLHEVTVDCSGLTHSEAILNLIDDVVRARTSQPDDIVYVRLAGHVSPAADPTVPDGFLADRYFHVQVDASGLRPDYDLGAYADGDDPTTEGRFVRRLLAELEDAADPESRAAVERAIYYGLDALRQGRVRPRHAS